MTGFRTTTNRNAELEGSRQPVARRVASLLAGRSVAAAACIAALSPRAFAEERVSERALAEALFREAKQLMAAERYSEACPKLAESQRLDPGGGTLLNLALCHEKDGKVATAWAEFQDARSVARREGRTDREALADEHIAALEPELAKLIVTVAKAESKPNGFVVAMDGAPLGEPAWGTPVPVDPGEHVVRATAPGMVAWEQHVTASKGASVSVDVPALARAAGVSDATEERRAVGPDAAPARSETGGAARTAAWVVGGAGVVALGIGTYFGLHAISLRQQSDDKCPNDRCTPEGVSLNDSAKSSALGADIGVGIGIAALVTSVYLFVKSSPSTASDARASRGEPIVPVVGPGVAALYARTSF